jgi:hypothetical protein
MRAELALSLSNHISAGQGKGKIYTVRAHSRKFTMPKRQFIGDGPDTQRLIKGVIDDNLQKFNLSLTSFIKK